MKTKYLFLLLMLFIAASSCEDDSDVTTLKVSQSTIETSELKSTFSIDIQSNSAWAVHSNADWCTPNKSEGEGNDKITISLAGNSKTATRKAEINIVSKDGQLAEVIKVTQEGTIPYELPVIFHVLYKNPSNHLQYVNRDRLAYILDKVNERYQNNTSSVDMNLTFKLATIDSEGNPMTSPGVEYIQWPETYPIDCVNFMNDKTGKYVKYLWDPNKYINVMVYNFYTDDSNSTTLGISHMPFSTKGDTFLEGLNPTSQTYMSMDNILHPHCASINSLCIDYESVNNSYDPRDIIVTLAHELGHYLGLHHVFAETDTGELTEDCEDTDYCEDTPSYNKKEYDAEYIRVMSGSSNLRKDQYFAYLVKRQDCSNQQFTSRNIMDYSVSFCDEFTSDQRDRIRHVLTYSPLIPGPKKGQANTRSAAQGPLDLPLLIRK